MKTRIYLVRHGEAEANIKRTFNGHTDGMLTPKGEKQAECVAKKFKDDIDIDYIYTSDLSRAYTTGCYIAEAKEMFLMETEELRELNGGVWENRAWTELEKAYPKEYEIWENEPHLAQMPNGESMAQLQDRILQALFEIADRIQGKSVAVVSHGIAIRTAATYFYGLTLEGIKTVPYSDNTAITTIDIDNDNFENSKILDYANVDHLPQELRTMQNQAWWSTFMDRLDKDRNKYLRK